MWEHPTWTCTTLPIIQQHTRAHSHPDLCACLCRGRLGPITRVFLNSVITNSSKKLKRANNKVRAAGGREMWRHGTWRVCRVEGEGSEVAL